MRDEITSLSQIRNFFPLRSLLQVFLNPPREARDLKPDLGVSLICKIAIFFLIEVFLIKVTKTHELFLDATFFFFKGG